MTELKRKPKMKMGHSCLSPWLVAAIRGIRSLDQIVTIVERDSRIKFSPIHSQRSRGCQRNCRNYRQFECSKFQVKDSNEVFSLDSPMMNDRRIKVEHRLRSAPPYKVTALHWFVRPWRSVRDVIYDCYLKTSFNFLPPNSIANVRSNYFEQQSWDTVYTIAVSNCAFLARSRGPHGRSINHHHQRGQPNFLVVRVSLFGIPTLWASPEGRFWLPSCELVNTDQTSVIIQMSQVKRKPEIHIAIKSARIRNARSYLSAQPFCSFWILDFFVFI